MPITFVPVLCDATAYKDFDEEDNALEHYIVLYDDDCNSERAGLYVPCHATYTPHFLTHKPPEYYATRMQFYDYIKQMTEDYEGITTTIRNEVVDLTKEHRVGLVDLCTHGGQYTNASKQVALAYLLMVYGGCQEKAWAEMLKWFGEGEDHWRNIGDVFAHYIIRSIKDRYELLEEDLHFTSDDDEDDPRQIATRPNSSADSSPRPLSQYD